MIRLNISLNFRTHTFERSFQKKVKENVTYVLKLHGNMCKNNEEYTKNEKSKKLIISSWANQLTLKECFNQERYERISITRVEG